jgi:hypothetical protein
MLPARASSPCHGSARPCAPRRPMVRRRCRRAPVLQGERRSSLPVSVPLGIASALKISCVTACFSCVRRPRAHRLLHAAANRTRRRRFAHLGPRPDAQGCLEDPRPCRCLLRGSRSLRLPRGHGEGAARPCWPQPECAHARRQEAQIRPRLQSWTQCKERVSGQRTKSREPGPWTSSPCGSPPEQAC